MERSELQRLRDGDPGLRGREAGPDPGSVARLADVNLQLRGAERGFRPRRRWLTTALEGLSWEAKTRVAGHFSVGRGKGGDTRLSETRKLAIHKPTTRGSQRS